MLKRREDLLNKNDKSSFEKGYIKTLENLRLNEDKILKRLKEIEGIVADQGYKVKDFRDNIDSYNLNEDIKNFKGIEKLMKEYKMLYHKSLDIHKFLRNDEANDFTNSPKSSKIFDKIKSKVNEINQRSKDEKLAKELIKSSNEILKLNKTREQKVKEVVQLSAIITPLTNTTKKKKEFKEIFTSDFQDTIEKQYNLDLKELNNTTNPNSDTQNQTEELESPINPVESDITSIEPETAEVEEVVNPDPIIQQTTEVSETNIVNPNPKKMNISNPDFDFSDSSNEYSLANQLNIKTETINHANTDENLTSPITTQEQQKIIYPGVIEITEDENDEAVEEKQENNKVIVNESKERQSDSNEPQYTVISEYTSAPIDVIIPSPGQPIAKVENIDKAEDNPGESVEKGKFEFSSTAISDFININKELKSSNGLEKLQNQFPISVSVLENGDFEIKTLNNLSFILKKDSANIENFKENIESEEYTKMLKEIPETIKIFYDEIKIKCDEKSIPYDEIKIKKSGKNTPFYPIYKKQSLQIYLPDQQNLEKFKNYEESFKIFNEIFGKNQATYQPIFTHYNHLLDISSDENNSNNSDIDTTINTIPVEDSVNTTPLPKVESTNTDAKVIIFPVVKDLITLKEANVNPQIIRNLYNENSDVKIIVPDKNIEIVQFSRDLSTDAFIDTEENLIMKTIRNHIFSTSKQSYNQDIVKLINTVEYKVMLEQLPLIIKDLNSQIDEYWTNQRLPTIERKKAEIIVNRKSKNFAFNYNGKIIDLPLKQEFNNSIKLFREMYYRNDKLFLKSFQSIFKAINKNQE
jgi:hypothetical protein